MTTCDDPLRPRPTRLAADRAGGAHDQPTHGVAHQGHVRDVDRPGVDQVLQQGRESGAVLAEPEPGVGPQQHGSPPQPLERVGVRRTQVLAVAVERRVALGQPVQQDGHARGRLGVRRPEGLPRRRDVAPVAADRERDGEPGPLARQPVADDAVHRRGRRPTGGRLLQRRAHLVVRQDAEPGRQGPEPGPHPGVHRRGDPAVQRLGHAGGVAGRAAQGSVHAVRPGLVRVADGPDDDLVGHLGQQRRSVEQAGSRGDAHALRVRERAAGVNDLGSVLGRVALGGGVRVAL